MNQSCLFHVQLLTLFPEMFPGPLSASLAGKALQKGVWGYETINIRDFAKDKHKTVDDSPYGGGTGMVMRADVVADAVDASVAPGTKLLYPSPRGKMFTQSYAMDLVKEKNIAIICGRFEGVDQRFLDAYDVEEVSVGDYILSGGEVAALVILDACIRTLPGVIGKKEALDEESFGSNADYAGLLEYPLYTEPRIWRGREVPGVLLSGHHANIATWRHFMAKDITQQRRSDLWQKYIKHQEKNHDKRT